MKTHSYLFLALLCAVACSGNKFNDIPEIKYGGLNGKVVSTRDSRYDVEDKFGEIVPDELEEVVVTVYDSDGHQIKYTSYDSDGDLQYRLTDIYEKGLLKKEVYEYGWNDSKTEYVVAERRKNYLKLNQTDANGDSIIEIFYDGLHSCNKDEDGDVIFESFYDKKGHLTEQKSYNYAGEVTYHIKQEFDKKGNLVKSIKYYSSHGDPEVTTYTYQEFDKKGNWITQYIQDEDGDVTGIVKREITYR